MSEIKAVYPLLEGISIGQSTSERGGCTCYAAMNTETGEKYILKHISIPESQVQVEALILTGSCADEASVKEYYTTVTEDLKQELNVLSSLGNSRGFLPYVGFQIEEKEEGVGYDAYLLGTYRKSLAAYARKNAFTHLRAVNLSMDLCAALAECRQAGYLYLNLKPENVYLQGQNHVIGDIGFVALDALAYASFPDKYLSAYSAPELNGMFASINTTVDTYALGMVLYQIYNGGRLPFEDESDPDTAAQRRAKGEALPAPIYADYEMAEIILKACAFAPEDRWKSPEEMGQALVAYMQRNEVTDSIIAPPIVTDLPLSPDAIEGESEEALSQDESADDSDQQVSQAPSEDQRIANMTLEELLAGVTLRQDGEADAPTVPTPSAAAAQADQQAAAEISAMLQGQDDSAPSEEDVDPEAVPADEAFAGVLAQADDLIQHAEEVAQAEAEERQRAEDEAREKEEAERAAAEAAAREAEEKLRAEQEAQAKAESEALLREKKEKTKGRKNFFITLAIILLVAAIFATGGYLYYKNIYCLYVTGMEITESSQTALTVAVTTQEDPSLLLIRCTDTYGNTQEKSLQNGQVTFENLEPDTKYTITAVATGFHQLVGSNIQVTYATNPNTEIANLTAVAGQEEGSVILNLTVSGPEPEAWYVFYQSGGEPGQSQTFTGHMVTITGLDVGKTYKFQLSADDHITLTGTTSLEFTTSEIVSAENLVISDFTGDSVTVSWDQPETPVDFWTVHCYNESGFDFIQQVTECSAVISGIDTSTATTVEVTAAGNTLGSHVYISKDPIVITSTSAEPGDDPTQVNLSWEYTGTTPTGGWLLMYSFGSSQEAMQVAHSDTNSVQLTGLIPGAEYACSIQTADGTLSIFDGSFTMTTEKGGSFSGYGVTGAGIYMALFPTPDAEDWTFDDVNVATYTNTFSVNDLIAFVLEILGTYRNSEDEITTTCVVRDAQGSPVDYYTGTEQWHAMWTENMYLGDLERTPQTPGKYTLDIYFNGDLVKSMPFTITE